MLNTDYLLCKQKFFSVPMIVCHHFYRGHRPSGLENLSFLRPGAGTCPGASWDRNSRRKLLGSIKGDSWLNGPSSLLAGKEDCGQRSHILWAGAFTSQCLPSANSVHIYPRMTLGFSCPVWMISLWYKLTPLYSAEITSSELDMHTIDLF